MKTITIISCLLVFVRTEVEGKKYYHGAEYEKKVTSLESPSTRAGIVWSYANVNDWPTEFEESCGGEKQSPINIDRFSTKYGFFLYTLSFSNYELIPTTVDLKNNGHTVSATYSGITEVPYIEGAWLRGRYNFDHLHFHFGSDSTKGSEHTVNSVRYPMEIHLVHYKASYDDLTAAASNEDGLAVLGILFEQSTQDNPALAPLIAKIPDLVQSESHASATDFYALASLLPENVKKYYRYYGGLTTPLCNEVVTWTVFTEPIGVSLAQLEALRTLKDLNDGLAQDNFRPPQPLNGRTIYRSF